MQGDVRPVGRSGRVISPVHFGVLITAVIDPRDSRLPTPGATPLG
jgi:hypothetical protein